MHYYIDYSFNIATVKCDDQFVAEFASLRDAKEYCLLKNVQKDVASTQHAYYPGLETPCIDISIKLIYAAIEEFVEALRELPSRKSWAALEYSNKKPDWEALTKELIDVQLFLYAILYWLDIDNAAFISGVRSKQIKNTTRIDHANLQRQTE